MAHPTTHASARASHGDHEHPLVGHLVPISTLVATATALLVLTVITVAVRYIDLGEFNIHLAIGVAAIKAILVCLFFMHLFWDRPFNQLVLIGSVAFVALLMVFVLMDSGQYNKDLVPGNPKMVQQKLDAEAPAAPIAKRTAP